MTLGFKAADALSFVPANAAYDTLCNKLIQCYSIGHSMLEAQDELACLQLGDWTLCQLAIRVQQLVMIALRGANETIRESYRLNVFFRGPTPKAAKGDRMTMAPNLG